MSAPPPLPVSTASPEPPGAAAWRAIRGASDIQFTPLADPPPAVPSPFQVWLARMFGRLFGWIGEALGWIFGPIFRLLGLHGTAIQTGILALAVLGLAAMLGVLARRWWLARVPKARPVVDAGITRERALALLSDADALAAAGRYGEAVRLLLGRSLGEIAEARPGALPPARTAREVSADPNLPERATRALAVIAREVERSLFALGTLAADDWQRARAAYADFALADLAPQAPAS